MLAQAPQRLDQIDRPVPRPERTGEHDQRSGGWALEGDIACGAGGEPRRIGAPFDLHDTLGRHPGRQNVGLRRDEEISVPALPIAPAPHRLHQQRPVEPALGRAGVVDDRCVDLQHRERPGRPRGDDALAAEVVVPLDHHVGPDPLGQRPYPPRQQPAQAPRAQRRRQVDPSGAVVRKRPGAAGHQHVNLVPERGQTGRHRGDVHRAADLAGHALVRGGVQNPHATASPTTSSRSRSTRSARRAQV